MEKFFSARIIRRLEALLPLMAEDGTASQICVDALQQRLAAEFPQARAGSTDTALDCCLLVLRLAGVLDLQRLEQGEISFISYPARTVGVSLLRLLARQSHHGDEGIFPRNFWTESESVTLKKERRDLLEKMAEYLDTDPDEPVVRYSHVSFALLRCNGYFLCHKREISTNDGDRKKGMLVLPGGRLELRDLPSGSGSREEQLFLLTGPEGLKEHADASHRNALMRELREELVLEDTMYEARLFKKLPPYRGRHGGGDKHALTSTSIWLYQISLKPEAMPVLLRHFDPEYAKLWVSAEELLQTGQSPAGEKIFFDAGRDQLTVAELDALEDSMPSLDPPSARNSAIILCYPKLKASIGEKPAQKKAGRPKHKKTFSLTKEQGELLLALGMAKWNFTMPRENSPLIRFPMEATPDALCQEAMGGLQFTDDRINTIFSGLPPEIQACCWRNGNHIRLLAYFSMTPDSFSYEIVPVGTAQKCVRIRKNAMTLPALGLSCPECRHDIFLPDKALAIFEGCKQDNSDESRNPAELLRKTSESRTDIPLKAYVAGLCMEDNFYTPEGEILIPRRDT
ncbi:hypothetical protein [uncultured Desulfovibrio sp.]|uniref:hypothetical protein n=1 Tax=uncultured Desulfovibrio sp. TaxID=167968 RepID=UPI002607C169|nr:hypothetical protein [uncultured Desulfovibrio sp.]